MSVTEDEDHATVREGGYASTVDVVGWPARDLSRKTRLLDERIRRCMA